MIARIDQKKKRRMTRDDGLAWKFLTVEVHGELTVDPVDQEMYLCSVYLGNIATKVMGGD